MNRSYFLILLLICLVFESQSQIKTYTIDTSVNDDVSKPRVVLPYDSMKNITRQNIISLIGQRVQVLPQVKDYQPMFLEEFYAPWIFLGNSYRWHELNPTMYTELPVPKGYMNSAVVCPDINKDKKIYRSKYNAFDNEIFNIVGVDSIEVLRDNNKVVKFFYLVVNNHNYPSNHYLEIGRTVDEYNPISGKWSYSSLASDNFIILGYFDKLKQRTIGKKYINIYESNYPIKENQAYFLSHNYIVFNILNGKPLTSIPQNHVWEVVDLAIIKTENNADIKCILSSDSIKDVFCNLSCSGLMPYDEYIYEQKQKEDWRKSMIRKYGKVNGNLIIEGKVKLGFTKKMCEEAWGRPSDINTTTGSWGVHEQWVYGSGCYLYFENGKLTAIDN